MARQSRATLKSAHAARATGIQTEISTLKLSYIKSLQVGAPLNANLN